jgi:hypothetical protein
MGHSGLSTAAWIGIGVAGTGVVVALLVGALNVWISVVNERRRTQPIVVAHEEHGRRFTDKPDYFAVGGYITNESSGHAFNVRFGVELNGVRFSQKLRATDPDSGNVQRVLRPGERRPTEGSWPVLIPQRSLLGTNGDPDPGRVYWARYENARTQTWETRNPADRSGRLDIRRVWFVGIRDRLERRRRTKAGQRGADWERSALAALRAGMTPTEKEDADVADSAAPLSDENHGHGSV